MVFGINVRLSKKNNYKKSSYSRAVAKILNLLTKSGFAADTTLSTRNKDLHETLEFLYTFMLMKS